jgi:hypothetical protein
MRLKTRIALSRIFRLVRCYRAEASREQWPFPLRDGALDPRGYPASAEAMSETLRQKTISLGPVGFDDDEFDYISQGFSIELNVRE